MNTLKPALMTPREKARAVFMYSRLDKPLGDIAVELSCTVEHVERVLKAEGQLL